MKPICWIGLALAEFKKISNKLILVLKFYQIKPKVLIELALNAIQLGVFKYCLLEITCFLNSSNTLVVSYERSRVFLLFKNINDWFVQGVAGEWYSMQLRKKK